MQTWHPSTNIKYRKLQKEIWMSPNRQDNISRLVEAFLLGLGRGFLNIKTLEINGCFNAADVRITQTTTFSGIQTLEVRSFQLLNSQEATRSFLLAFPNLLYLSIGFQGWGPSIPDIIGELRWRKLRTLCLHDIWASEQDILGILEHHMSTLKEFSLHHAALTQGSWKSLFTRIRQLRFGTHHVQVTATGELYGRRSQDTLILQGHASDQLANFLKDQKLPWPFGKPEHI
jgi:hypothetical protein